MVCTVQHGLVPGRLPKTCERRTTRIRARAVDGIMTFKTWDTEFRNPDTVAYLHGLADEESVCKHIVGSRPTGAGCRWSIGGGKARLAVKCCLENMRWPNYLGWRACRVAAA